MAISQEGKIFDALVCVVRESNLKSELRVAGGWVRDKLLGLDSHDIDIAVDNMTGREFAELVAPSLKRMDPSCSFTVVESNPDRSKHLETTKLRIWGHEIDLVNLRSETYSEHSRIPTSMKFGTPEEDACRRDLTINSLFYNLSTKEVEDLTGKGVTDLLSRIIRTPLPPLVTFLDDPLRVLRSIRFAARFDFELDKDLETTASSECVKRAFSTKIAEERMRTEVQAMLFGHNPAKAVQLLHKLGYLELVLKPPKDVDWESSVLKLFEPVCHVLRSISVPKGEKELILVAGLLMPFKKQDKTVLGSLLNCFGLKQRMLTQVESLYQLLGNSCFEEWFQLNKDILSRGEAVPFEGNIRVSAGIAFNRHQCCLLPFALFLSLQHVQLMSWQAKIFEAIVKSITLSGLLQLKHLLNGNDIKVELKISDGFEVGDLKEKAFVWQLQNPSGGKAECISWLLQTQLFDSKVGKRLKVEAPLRSKQARVGGCLRLPRK